MKKLFAFLILAGLFAYFVWPTRYEAYPAGSGPYAERAGNVATRVDRITGEVFAEKKKGSWEKIGMKDLPATAPVRPRQGAVGVDQNVASQQMKSIEATQAAADAATKAK